MASSRLQEPSFLILTALAAGPQHGYGVIKDVQEISPGVVTLRVGTLYGALDRLTAEGLVELDHEEVVDSRLRRYYRLTDAGGAHLAAEASRTRQQANTALRRLRESGAMRTATA
jgi:DNA-binding PadR family transcriptional regulator